MAQQRLIYPDFLGWRERVIHTKSGITFAPEDLYVLDEQSRRKEFFTWDEAVELEKKILRPNGWRLPTKKEWGKVACECRKSKNMRRELHLSLNGFILQVEVETYNMNPSEVVPEFYEMYSYYWSNTRSSNNSIYNLFISASKIRLVHGSNSAYCNSIRCVAL